MAQQKAIVSSQLNQNSMPAAAALPAGWETHTSRSTGQTYYVNEGRNISQWEMPPEFRQAFYFM